jgi:hypothetical protein
MSLTCLEDIVGFDGGCPSQTFLQNLGDLPGLSIKTINLGADSSYANAYELIGAKVKLAIKQIEKDFLNSLTNKMELDLVQVNGYAGYISTEPTQDLARAVYKGILVDFLDSKYNQVFIESLTLYTTYTGNIDVKLWNAITGELLDTVTIAVTSGQIAKLPVNWVLQPTNHNVCYFIGYDATLVDSFVTEGWDVGMYAYSMPLNAPVVRNNTLNGNGSGGLGINYSLQCGFNNYICSIRNMLELPLLYLVGKMIVDEIRFSGRLTSIVVARKDDLTEMGKLFQETYTDLMKQLVMGARIPQDRCFRCKEKVAIITRIP